MNDKRLHNLLAKFLFIILILLSIYLRLWHLEDNPGWYTDEATHIEIARNLMQGEIRYFAIEDSWLLFARLPVFEYALAGLFKVSGVDITVLRTLTGMCGVITTALLYFFIRDISGHRHSGLLACASFALFPQAILYNRFGFSYNLLLPLIMMILWGYVRYRHTSNVRWLLLSASCIGIASLSDVVMWSFVPTLFFITWQIRLRDGLPASILALSPVALYFLMQFITVPDAFLFDLSYTLGRSGGGTIAGQVRLLMANYQVILQNPLWITGIVGIFLIEDRHLRYSVMIMLLPLVFVGRTVPLYSLSTYYVLPFLPLIAIGVGFFIEKSVRFALKQQVIVRSVILILIFMPIIQSSYQMIVQVQSGLTTAIDAFLIDAEDARSVGYFINDNSTEVDFVIASAPVGWQLDTRVAEFQMVAVADGLDAVHIPSNLPENRFAFSTDYEEARYVVIDDLWRNWGAIHMPQIAEMVVDVQEWDMVFEAGSIQVYENPAVIHDLPDGH